MSASRAAVAAILLGTSLGFAGTALAQPAPCTNGTDSVSGDPWVVCTADASKAWLSCGTGPSGTCGGGIYHPLTICQGLGYDTVSRWGGNYGSVCAYGGSGTSCSSPGSQVFDGGGAYACGTDTLCYTVTWECSTAPPPSCGNGTVDFWETCDDGNTVDGDCCSSTCAFEAADSPCTSDGNLCTLDTCDGAGTCQHADTPAESCLGGLSTALRIKNSDVAGKDKLLWQLSLGDAFDQAVLGDPVDHTNYALCVYDTVGSASSLSASLPIPTSPLLWTSKDPKGLLYKSKDGVGYGVTKALLKTGDDGKTKAKVLAGRSNLLLPVPAGETFFSQDPKVVVQLHNDEGTCWTSEFAPEDTKSNTAEGFKAKRK